MELIDVLGLVAPRFTARWLWHRRMLADVRRSYDAAKPSQYRPVLSNVSSGDGAMNQAGTRLREISRTLDENHDLVVAILDDIVNNVVGAGVQPVPMVRTRSGELATRTNDRILELFQEWAEYPETTGDFGWEAMQRQVLLSKLRDGEIFLQHVDPNAGKAFRFRTTVPYAVELIEADLVPFLYQDVGRNILHGIENNAWNAAVAYWVLKNHPGDPLQPSSARPEEMKRVPAELVMHLKYVRRLRQRRGVTALHAVLNRMRDLKDYEESERIAARVAADFTWYIKRTAEWQGSFDASVADNRVMEMTGGMGFTLNPGEDVGTIKSDRPNAALEDFRNAMLRAVAGGTGTRFSSIARNYNGTYSAQRQELVEGAIAYRAHFADLARRFYRPLYQRWVAAASLTRALQVSGEAVDPATLGRVDFRAPALPWIDPAKEATAYQTLVTAGLESRQEIMRQRGRDPGKVWEEIEEEQASGLFASTVDQAGGDLEFGGAAGGGKPDDDDQAEAA